jgi:hypothetical protein
MTTLPEFAVNITIDRSELIPGSNGTRWGYSDEYPGHKFLVIPVKEELT